MKLWIQFPSLRIYQLNKRPQAVLVGSLSFLQPMYRQLVKLKSKKKHVDRHRDEELEWRVGKCTPARSN
jgi:hypothetical protein